MAELPNRPQGNSPVPESYEWVTPDEAEQLDKMLFKPFIRKKELNAGDNKKFFYRIIGSHPFVPATVLTSSTQHLVNFEVRKYYRNEFVDSKRRDGGMEVTEKVNKQVEWVTLDDMGNGSMIDADAAFFIDARKFKAEFERDKE